MMRSHRAGDLRADDVGESVVICGWVASRRDHGGKVFLDVRDVAGVVQAVVDPQLPGLEVAHRLRHEWVVRVVGDVSARPEGTVNDDLPTGAVEVVAREIEVLSEAEPSPFPSTTGSTSTRFSACGIAISICAARRCSATCDFVRP